MKIALTILALLNGGYMLIDGIFVMIKGKYIGPVKPGPWAALFNKFDINVFKLGPLFIFFGLCWLGWLVGLWSNPGRVYLFGLVLSILTLWYFPVGTFISVIVIAILIILKNKNGL